MNWINPPATGNQPGSNDRLGQGSDLPPEQSSLHQQTETVLDKTTELSVGKALSLSAASGQNESAEVFTLSLGRETIELLPLKNWSQLDVHKWTARGKFPAVPAGLEVSHDRVRIAGETVALNDPAGCAKLERLFSDWLLLERETQRLAHKGANRHPLPASSEASAPVHPAALRFHVEVDKRSQVHIHCVRGKETIALIGLTVAGLTSLHQQGLMRKPRSLATGALHDWVELEGELFSFEKGQNDAARLEQILNERYLPTAAAGFEKEVVIFVNAASSTGFDIQFPVTVGGVPDNHRFHLNDESLELLQDTQRCGLMHKEVIVKLIPPNLIFKRKTADGGEQYLAWCPENTLTLTDEEGVQKSVPLSQPLNLMRLSAAELTAVFNHPAINRHTRMPIQEPPPKQLQAAPTVLGVETLTEHEVGLHAPQPTQRTPVLEITRSGRVDPGAPAPVSGIAHPSEPGSRPVESARPLPNLWLREILARPPLRHDWFVCLAYSKMAERCGNSSEGKFGQANCWFIHLGGPEDISDLAFKGVFLTEKGGFGFLNQGQVARFNNGVAFVGTRQSALEGIQVHLVGVGLDAQARLVFIVSDGFRLRFGVGDSTLNEVLARLSDRGAVIRSVTEILASNERLEVVWTVPAEQPDPKNPQVLESTRTSA